MARSAAIPLAIAGFGSLILISGIEGQSLSEVIKGEIGKGKSPLDPSGNNPNSPGSGSEVGSVPGGVENVPIGGTTAIPPGKVNPNTQAATLLQKLERGEAFRTQVKEEVEKGQITTRQGSEKFHHRFPRFEQEANELKELLKTVKK